MKRSLLLIALLAFTTVPLTTAQIRQARRALRDGNFQAAHEAVAAALAEDDEDHNAYELRAEIHQAQAEASEGLERVAHLKEWAADLRLVLELRPRNENEIMPQFLMAYQTYFMGGVDAFNQATTAADEGMQAGLYEAASLGFQSAAAVMPDSLDPHINWAFAEISGGTDTDAIVPLIRAIEIGPVEVDWYNYLARIYLTNEQAAEAVEVLNEASDAFPANEEIQALLLNAYNATGQNDLAVDRYIQRVEDMPEDALSRYNLGSLLLQQEQYDAAIEHLLVATDLDPANGNAWYNLGAAYINKATDLQTTISDLDDALRAERDALEEAEVDARQAEIDALVDQRRSLMGEAIPHLETAKGLAESDGTDVSGICRALYQAYAQVDSTMDRVDSVAACAGFDDQ